MKTQNENIYDKSWYLCPCESYWEVRREDGSVVATCDNKADAIEILELFETKKPESEEIKVQKIQDIIEEVIDLEEVDKYSYLAALMIYSEIIKSYD